MIAAHLNEPTLDLAREAYLKTWHLDSVQQAWGGKKPSQAQYNKRFKIQWEKRQRKIAKAEGTSTALLDKEQDTAQTVIEALAEALKGSNIDLSAILGQDADESDDELEQEPEAEAPTARIVKDENYGELPTPKQFYFFAHRAVESGSDFIVIPVKRGIAAEGISYVKDGDDVNTALGRCKALVEA